MRKMIASLGALLLIAAAQPSSPTGQVNTARMSEITRVLASDEFQGRSPGTAGEDKTIPYLIDQFKAAGLEPAGENGGWTQTVPMIRTKLEAPTFTLRQGGQTTNWSFPGDVYFTTVRDTDAAKIAAAPIVFVGYGVHAPERNWDDFKGVDLKGKVALFLVNDPDFEAAAGEPAAGKFGGKAMTFYGRWVYKYDEAARRGAIAALIVHETDAAGYGWNVVKSGGGENYNIVLSPGALQPVLLQGWIQLPAAEALLKRAGYDFATLKRQARSPNFRPIDLHATFSADSKVELARSMVGMVVRAGAEKPDIGTVDAFRAALLAAKSIAYSDSGSGTYLSATLFPKLGVADQLAAKSRKVRGPPSGEPVAAVIARGEAEIGFQQLSELIHVPGVTFVGTIPAELQPGFSFAGALTSAVRQPEAATALIRFLASPEAAPVIAKAGLTPPSSR